MRMLRSGRRMQHQRNWLPLALVLALGGGIWIEGRRSALT
jgi:hypothetical protein